MDRPDGDDQDCQVHLLNDGAKAGSFFVVFVCSFAFLFICLLINLLKAGDIRNLKTVYLFLAALAALYPPSSLPH